MTTPRQTPLLDMWEAPQDAGEPVGVFASTFDIEPDFFERNCLARFLAVESVSEGGKSVDDIVAQVELEEKLTTPIVTILADRSAQAERSSLRWNLLHCAVANGLLHAKASLLLWENATRVIVSSANLTPTGYRTNLELAVAADLGDECMLPGQVLTEIADELEAYLDLVPGLNAEVPARIHATSMIELFRVRLAEKPSRSSGVRVTMAPTTPDAGPLERLSEVWRGGMPLEATHLSPFWDNDNSRALDAVSNLLTGRPASSHRHDVGVTVGMTGKIAFPQAFSSKVNSVCLLESADDKIPRPLHAKCLVLRSNDWIAALIGSSNHTTAGLGLGPQHSRRHRELNLWIGAPINSDAGAVLTSLITLGKPLPSDIDFEDSTDDDDSEDIVALPTFFTLSRIAKVDDTWQLSMGFDGASPGRWRKRYPTAKSSRTPTRGQQKVCRTG